MHYSSYNEHMTKIFTYSINDKEYNVALTYRSTSRIRYVYRKDGFHISAPYLTRKSTIVEGLDKYASKLIEKFHENIGYTNDHIYILGIKVDLKGKTSIGFNDGTVVKFDSVETLLKKLRPVFLKIVTERTRYYETVMKCDEHKVRVRNMKTRLGSNSKATKTIAYSLSLLHYSMEVIDSVVIHELAHDYYFDHSDKFYKVLYKYCPRYDEYRKRLLKGKFSND